MEHPPEPSGNRAATGYRRGFFLAAATVLLALSLALYLEISTLPGKSSLSEDELWAASLSTLSFFKSIVFVLRFDNHPPLYYMQLNLWALAGHGDRWLQMNSALWLLGTGIAVLALVRRSAGPVAALIASGLVLSSPILVDYGLELRMYAFLGFLTMLGILVSEPLFDSFARAGTAPRRQWLAVFLVDLVIIYSYATGPIIIVTNFVYGVLTGRRARVNLRCHLRWLGLHVVLAILALPVVVNSVLRGAGHALLPDAGIVASTLSELAVGTPAGQLGPWTLPALLVLAAAGLAAVATVPNARHLVAAYLFLPLLIGFAVSHLATPIWLTRAFLFSVPVFALALGRALGVWLELPIGRTSRAIVALGAAGIVGLQAATSYRAALPPKEPNYPALVAVLQQQAEPGDCIVAVKGLDAFWGVARYFAGPDWGDALAVQAPPAQRWVKIMAAVPPSVSSWLGWTAHSDRFDHAGIHVVSGYPDDLGQSCNRVFLIGNAPEFQASPAVARAAPILAESGWVSLRGPLAAASLH
jgi:mannosyltransferase